MIICFIPSNFTEALYAGVLDKVHSSPLTEYACLHIKEKKNIQSEE